jgi:hypothetical protein
LAGSIIFRETLNGSNGAITELSDGNLNDSFVENQESETP